MVGPFPVTSSSFALCAPRSPLPFSLSAGVVLKIAPAPTCLFAACGRVGSGPRPLKLQWGRGRRSEHVRASLGARAEEGGRLQIAALNAEQESGERGLGSTPRSGAPAPGAQRLGPSLRAWASWPRVPSCLTRGRTNQGERPGMPCDGRGGSFPQIGQREERTGARREPSRAAVAEAAAAQARTGSARIPGRPAQQRARRATAASTGVDKARWQGS